VELEETQGSQGPSRAHKAGFAAPSPKAGVWGNETQAIRPYLLHTKFRYALVSPSWRCSLPLSLECNLAPLITA
jgi:hypothetical protein